MKQKDDLNSFGSFTSTLTQMACVNRIIIADEIFFSAE